MKRATAREKWGALILRIFGATSTEIGGLFGRHHSTVLEWVCPNLRKNVAERRAASRTRERERYRSLPAEERKIESLKREARREARDRGVPARVIYKRWGVA